MEVAKMDGIRYANPIIFYDGEKLANGIAPITYPGVLPNAYYLTPYGEIISMVKKPRLIHGSPDRDGYIKVGLQGENGKRVYTFIHRLVAHEYIINPFPDQYDMVNHMDANHTNNEYLNLEWCDNDTNREHAKINKLFKRCDEHPYSLFSNQQVIEICEMLESGMTESEIRDYYGITRQSNLQLATLISHIKCRQCWLDISSKYNF
jgi:hypothetical protein